MKLYTEKFVHFVVLLALCVHTAESQFHELAGAKEERKEINSDLGSRANRTKQDLVSS